jgi:hypothetical protein
VADGDNGLMILNISNPLSITFTGIYDTDGYADDVAVAGNYACISGTTYTDYGSNDYLEIVDINDPSAPVRAGKYNIGSAFDLAVAGNYAYVAAGDSGLKIVDISDSSSPKLGGIQKIPNIVNNVAVAGKYVYVTTYKDEYDVLEIIDISNPSSPKLVGICDTGNYREDIAVSGNYAYVIGDNGIVILDISNQESPRPAGSYVTAVGAEDVAVADNYVYIADFSNGLVILSVDGAADTIPPADKLTIVLPKLRWSHKAKLLKNRQLNHLKNLWSNLLALLPDSDYYWQ